MTLWLYQAPHQRRRSLCRLRSVTLVPLLSLLFSWTFTAGQVAPYQASPIELHRKLREAFVIGTEVGAEVRAIIRETGDHSFDTLLTPSPSKLVALRLQTVAWKAWSERDYARAVDLYREAAALLKDSGLTSEVAFCLYYIAEIFSEREEYSQSLEWIGQALAVATSRNRPYLEALIFQSRGYSLWFANHLQASIHSFTLALERWHTIGFREGMVTSWNNLAALYEELRLWDKADHYYKRAFELTENSLDAEIRFYLHANYSVFLHNRHQPSQAIEHLAQARELKEVSPGKFLLLEAKILGVGKDLTQLLSFQPQLPSLRIERALLLGQFLQDSGERLQAYRHFEEALRESKESGLRYFTRDSALHLGAWLEKDGQYERASQLYFATLREDYNAAVPEVVFPYWRTVSPLFDGWIRSLIRLGRVEEAWQEIQRLVQLRRRKGQRATESIFPVEFKKDEVSQFILAGKLETQGPLPAPWETAISIELRAESIFEMLSSQGAEPFTIVEMWPDGRSVYAWVIRSSGYVFRELVLPQEITETVQEIVDPLYSALTSLPPPPTSGQLQLVYSHLIEPLEEFFDSNSILFIGHKELQPLPLEMLQNRRGEFLLEHYNFSYLPSVYGNAKQEPSSPSAPILIRPNSSLDLPEIQAEETFFKTLFPDLQVSEQLEGQFPPGARWVHISTHFRLDQRFWLASGFANGPEELNVFRFLQHPLSCTLLSLGVCDAGNAYTSDSPYWLGFSELFLNTGVQALLVNRWRLDEIASRIYRDFYVLSRQGLPMDQAITQARLRFMSQTFRRGTAKVTGQHPFFWAGVTYVGVPGRTLYPKPQWEGGLLLWGVSLGTLLVFTFGVLALSTRRRR